MEHVYQKFFGLTEAPFNITPDPSFLYLSPSHREALAQLEYGISTRRGFIVLTGEVGTGKTTLIRTLLSELPEDVHTAFLFSPISNPADLFRYVCEEFGLIEPMKGTKQAHDYISLLNDFLLQKYRLNENAALIIDEAQNLSSEVLESIRLLSNFETTKDKLLQILLVGQPELADRLNTLQLRQLKQRVTFRHHLRLLTLNECQQYIGARLKQAGSSYKFFSAKTIEEVYRYSGGIPRLINVICDNAMISAYALGSKEISASLVREVAEDLYLTANNMELRPLASRKEVPTRTEMPLNPEPQVRALGSERSFRTEAQLQGDGVKHSAAQIVALPRGFSVDRKSTFAAAYPVPGSFFPALQEALIDAMGPMAQIVLSDHVKSMGASYERFPRHKAAGLIEAVGREIFETSVRERFRKHMSDRFGDFIDS